jgi:hypothetical protein
MKFIVTITNGDDLKDLVFDVYNTDIAQKWAKEIINNYPLYEIDRFQAWPGSDKNLLSYTRLLKEQIDIVNTYKPDTIIFEHLLSQNTLNYLHRFFENLRGHIETGTEFYNLAPTNVKQAVDKFNVLIHEIEHLIRNSDTPTIIGTFCDRPRLPLINEDYEMFTINWKYGEVYINYCEVGKTLLDVFKDQDEYVGKDNVRPQQYYSADFMIKFGIELPNEFYQQRINEFNKWYSNQSYNFEKLSLGMIPVAILTQGEPYPGYTRIESVCIK